MARVVLLSLTLILVLLFCGLMPSRAAQLAAPGQAQRSLIQTLKQGRLPEPSLSSPDQVRDALGLPAHVARQILYHRYFEQWWYDQPFAIRLDFDYPQGEAPRLVGLAVRPAPP